MYKYILFLTVRKTLNRELQTMKKSDMNIKDIAKEIKATLKKSLKSVNSP